MLHLANNTARANFTVSFRQIATSLRVHTKSDVEELVAMRDAASADELKAEAVRMPSMHHAFFCSHLTSAHFSPFFSDPTLAVAPSILN